VGTRDLQTLWGAPQVLCALPRPVWPAHCALCTPVWLAERTVWPQTASRIHIGCIKGRGTSPGPPQRLPWPQSANVWDEHTDKRTPCLQCVNGGPSVAERRFRSLQMQRNMPAPSLLKLERERREMTELRYPGQCRQQPRKHTGLVLVHPWQRAWFMARDRGLRGEIGLRHRRGLILIPAVPHTWAPSGPRQVFFLPFGSLTVGTPVSNLKPGVGTWDLDWSGLRTQ